jgi:hypothetical protein
MAQVVPPQYRINFLVHFVGMSPRLSLKISILIISLIFLGLSSKIVVETCDCRDQVHLNNRKFLNGHGVLNSLRQAFIELCHFGSFVPGYLESVLSEFN